MRNSQPLFACLSVLAAALCVLSTAPIASARNGKRLVDCFYVYPTVSWQTTPNADLTVDPEVREIAVQQMGRLSKVCRVFAPVYRQFTIEAILNGQITEEVDDIAYGDVKSAFNEYLKKYNKGRGVILVGHSQGAGHLGRLIEEKIDRNSRLRKRMVSAMLIGGNIYVPKGKKVGGKRYGYIQFDANKDIDWFIDAFCRKGYGATIYRLRDDIIYAK